MGYPWLYPGTLAYTVDYDCSTIPASATPAWTMAGSATHTSIGGVLYVRGSGTGTGGWTLNSTQTGVNRYLFAKFKLHSGSYSDLMTVGKFAVPTGSQALYGTLVHYYDHRFRFLASGMDETHYECGDGSFRQFAMMLNQSTGVCSVTVDGARLSSGTITAAGSSTDNHVGFGRFSIATTMTASVAWDWVRYIDTTNTFFCFPLPAVDWHAHEIETERLQNVTWDGTVETVHARDDRFLSWRAVGLTSDQVDTLRAWYSSNASAGQTFTLIPDAGDMDTVHYVKWAGKDFKPRHDPPRSCRYSIDIRLRKVG